MNSTRARLLQATNELFRRFGFHGTSIKRVSQASGATIGSIYHFFPGGKDALAIEALTESGAAYRARIEAILDAAPDLRSGLRAVFDGAGTLLTETGFDDPCPIGGVARETAGSHEPIREACARVFADWQHMLANRLVATGHDAGAAHRFATTVIAALEGGFVVARTARDATSLSAIGDAIIAAYDALPSTGADASARTPDRPAVDTRP